ncbi:MAG TPA: hypothetical protein VL201_01455 [Patescibacteria group bacterium]|jgi:hypothetical protein|nr:hypothetical protein [Patescibacteria group bacterium]
MKKATVFFVKWVTWATIILAETVMRGGPRNILLKSVQHHEGGTLRSADLELGTMVLFFSEQISPILVHKKNMSDNTIEQRLLFPQVILPNEQVKAMIEHINSRSSKVYDLKFSTVQSPAKGLELCIRYRENEVLYDYETTISSASLPGYVFRFFNQVCCNDLIKRVNEKGVIHTVWQKKSHVL